MPINSLATYWRLQAVDTSGGTHPTGWGSGQFYSATSSQWQNMYNAEVTLYNNEVAAFNDMVSQRNIWAARADSAWGASRVYGSGESWEAAYARVYTDRYNQGYADARPPGSGATPIYWSQFYTWDITHASEWWTGPTITVDRAGFYAAVFEGHYASWTNEPPVEYRLMVNGGLVDYHLDDASGDVDNNASWTTGLSWSSLSAPGPIAGGSTVSVQCHLTTERSGSYMNGTLTVYFIPTQTYLH